MCAQSTRKRQRRQRIDAERKYQNFLQSARMPAQKIHADNINYKIGHRLF